MIDGPERRQPPITTSSSSERAIRTTLKHLADPTTQEERFRALLKKSDFWGSLRAVLAETIRDEDMLNAALFGAMVVHEAQKREEEIRLITSAAGTESGLAGIQALVPESELIALEAIEARVLSDPQFSGTTTE